MKVKVAQLCSTLCDPINCTVLGILPARILEWVTIPFSFILIKNIQVMYNVILGSVMFEEKSKGKRTPRQSFLAAGDSSLFRSGGQER